MRALRRRNEPMTADPRILGSTDFVEQLLREAEARQRATWRRAPRPQEIEAVIAKRCQRAGLSMAELQKGGRRGALSTVRADLGRALVTEFGLSLAETARHLGVSTAAISKILRKTDA